MEKSDGNEKVGRKDLLGEEWELGLTLKILER